MMSIPHIPRIGGGNILIRRLDIPDISIWNIYTPNPVPPFVPVTIYIGKPIVDIPGCVEVHPENKWPDGNKNKQLAEDDDTVTYCDANTPSYTPMNYNPEQLIIQREIPPPVVQPPPEVPSTEVPPTGDLTTETECPGPAQLRVGDLTQSGDERVIGHELQGTICVTLYEPTTTAQKFLPSANQASTTLSIAIIATAGAAATPLLIRLIKPAVKKAIATIQKKTGKKITRLTRQDIQTDEYRKKRGLPPIKR